MKYNLEKSLMKEIGNPLYVMLANAYRLKKMQQHLIYDKLINEIHYTVLWEFNNELENIL